MDLNQNHFELFGLPPRFRLDLPRLDSRYRELQREVHPDRFAAAPQSEQRVSMQLSTRVNEAYQTLKSPLGRAGYLLQLQGLDPGFETNTAMPAEFLEHQMLLRESLEAASGARDAAALDALRAALAAERAQVEAQLAARIDQDKDFDAAAARVRELKFLERLDAEIESAYDAIEA